MQADAPPGGSKLASQKYFSPHELNALGRVGQAPLPGVRKGSAARKAVAPTSSGTQSRANVVRKGPDLKKVEAPRSI